MKLLLSLTLALSLFANGCESETKFITEDGVTIFGDLHTAENANKSAPIILLFHQAGSNARAEYGPIIPRLTDAGYHVLAVDQRSGGDRLGGVNRTVEHAGANVEDYCAAYPDLQATLDYVKKKGYEGKTFVWEVATAQPLSSSSLHATPVKLMESLPSARLPARDSPNAGRSHSSTI